MALKASAPMWAILGWQLLTLIMAPWNHFFKSFGLCVCPGEGHPVPPLVENRCACSPSQGLHLLLLIMVFPAFPMLDT